MTGKDGTAKRGRGRPKKEKQENGAPKPTQHQEAGKSELTEDQRRALLTDAVGKVKPLKEKLRSTTADIRNLYKKAKADGVTKEMIDFALGLEDDNGEALTEAKWKAEIARWYQNPLGMQASFEFDRTPSVDKAYEEGKQAGLEGKDARPPVGMGQAQVQKWMEGWHEGQRIVMGGIKTRKDDLDDFDSLAPTAPSSVVPLRSAH